VVPRTFGRVRREGQGGVTIRGKSRWSFAHLAVVAALVLAWVPTLQSTAQADSCSTEDTIFWGDLASNGQWQTGATAEQGALRTVNRALNTACSGNITGSTSHVRLNGVTYNWVEVGWEKYDDGHYDAFTEWGINNNPSAQDMFSESCLTVGVESYYRTKLTTGDNWQLAFACYNGASWNILKTYTTLWASGIPVAETFRRGGSATHMSDTQDALQYRYSGTWYSWVQPSCFQDIAPGWHGNEVDVDSYTATSGSGDCPLGG
jgi:hypothetical protein